MLVYLLNVLLVSVYALIFHTIGKKKSERDRKSDRFIFIAICFCQCLLISCVRFNIGTDYPMYAYGFQSMAQSGFSEWKHEDWEIGYILLNKIVAVFTKNSFAIFSVTSVLCLAGPFYMIWRHSKNAFVSVQIFLNTYLFYLTLNYVRQGIAMSIMCFAFGFMEKCELGKGKNLLKNKNFWFFLLLTGVAATFHLPVIYLIPALFVSFIKVNWKTLPIYAVGLVVYFAISDKVLEVLLKHFHREYANSIFIKYGIAWHYTIVPLAICVAMIVAAALLKFKLSRRLNLLVHLTLMMGFWQIVMTKHGLFERFSYYTMIFIIIAVPEMVCEVAKMLSERGESKVNEKLTVKNPKMRRKNAEVNALERAESGVRKVVMVIYSVIMVLMLGYNLQGLIVPKNGAHGVLPYNTVFDVELPSIDGWFKR